VIDELLLLSILNSDLVTLTGVFTGELDNKRLLGFDELAGLIIDEDIIVVVVVVVVIVVSVLLLFLFKGCEIIFETSLSLVGLNGDELIGDGERDKGGDEGGSGGSGGGLHGGLKRVVSCFCCCLSFK